MVQVPPSPGSLSELIPQTRWRTPSSTPRCASTSSKSCLWTRVVGQAPPGLLGFCLVCFPRSTLREVTAGNRWTVVSPSPGVAKVFTRQLPRVVRGGGAPGRSCLQLTAAVMAEKLASRPDGQPHPGALPASPSGVLNLSHEVTCTCTAIQLNPIQGGDSLNFFQSASGSTFSRNLFFFDLVV